MGEERQQSEFNMAVSYLNRLNALFYAADDASISLDATSWFHTLMAIERELSTEMNSENERKKFKEARTKINDLLLKNTQQNKRTGQQEMLAELYDALHDFETDLRMILKEAGLQNRNVDDAMKALK
jgi:hypothetical protein